jgi:hypothetical protein
MRIRAAAPILFVAVFTGLLLAVALPSQASAAGKPCWKRVIDDWVDNGTIDGHYSTACLQKALKEVPEDLRDYSNLPDAINAALQNSIRGGGPGSGGSSGGNGSGSGSGSGGSDSSGQTGKKRELQAAPPPSYYRRAIDNLGTTSADSLPIPLLVLAGLGGALLLTAGGLVAARRIRAHRAGLPPTE